MIRAIVGCLEVIAVIGFILALLGGAMAGAAQGGVIGFLIGALIAFIASSLAFGVLFLLIENNQNLRAIKQLLEEQRKQL